MNISRNLIIALALTGASAAMAEAPAGYYSSCEGKKDQALLKQLESVISNHTTVSYKNLYSVYETSDKHPDGRIWDMYSTKNWGKSYSSASLCGSYKNVGDCINKEHSFPKSWFNDASPMMSDAFHIYPTDGKVNGQRSNYPYGECANGTTLPSNGSVKPLGKLGTSTFPGYSGRVFEPDDEYKGDFARSYFYMAACYNSRISSWNSDMLAHNSYPCFSTWAINLLLKWHRQDPVSDKETVRNDAVYKHQRNRNPFIDHPELAEYIWGDKKGKPWNGSAANEPGFLSPADKTTIDFGTTAVGRQVNRTLTVTGINFEENVKVSVTGGAFSVSSYSLPSAQVNASGASLTVTFDAVTAGNFTGTLTLASTGETVSLSLAGSAVNGLPALPATDIAEDGFTANWVCIDDASAQYTLDVRRQGASVEGYPRKVNAGACRYRVEGLEPETTYTYTISNGTLTSSEISVTTPAPLPSVGFLFDGELAFHAYPGQPSDPAELLAEIDNIPGDVTISVTAPFELSLNKEQWSTSVVLAPGADRFYMRLGATKEGTYTTSLVATADGGFRYDDVDVEGVVSDNTVASFIEDFEPASTGGSGYSEVTYTGSASTWHTNGCYFEKAGSNSYAHNGSTQAVRFGQSAKHSPRYIEMVQDKPSGAGKISFWARLWREDTGDCKFTVSVSSDKGKTWQEVGEVTVPSTKSTAGTNEYRNFSVTANKPGNIRVRIDQTAGERCMIDDLAITDVAGSGLLTPEGHAYHSWDAFCIGSDLVIENNDADNFFSVYSVDGRLMFASTAAVGRTSVALPAGLYVVAVADFSRRVLVR